jgi:hypothetical protein
MLIIPMHLTYRRYNVVYFVIATSSYKPKRSSMELASPDYEKRATASAVCPQNALHHSGTRTNPLEERLLVWPWFVRTVAIWW